MRTKFEFDLVPRDNFGDPDEVKTVTVEVKFTFYSDPQVGVDVDGNHSTKATFVEDLTVKVLDDDKRDVTNMVKTEYKEQYEEILDEARQFALWAVEEREEA